MFMNFKILEIHSNKYMPCMSLVICEIDLNLNNCLHGKFNLFYMSQCMHVPFITGVHLLSLHLKHFKKLLWNAFLVNNQMTCISVVNTFYHRELFFILCILVCHSLIDFAVFYVGFIIFGYIVFLSHVVYFLFIAYVFSYFIVWFSCKAP